MLGYVTTSNKKQSSEDHGLGLYLSQTKLWWVNVNKAHSPVAECHDTYITEIVTVFVFLFIVNTQSDVIIDKYNHSLFAITDEMV